MNARRHVPVFVVLPPRTLLLDVAGPIEALRKANLVQDAVRFDVRYVGPSTQVMTSIGLLVAGVGPLPDALPDGAMLVLAGDTDRVLDAGQATVTDGEDSGGVASIVAWLRLAMRPGHRLVCICSGALLAGRAGLLDGYRCTTHHACCAELAAVAPLATVLDDRLFVDDRGRCSSAGITAGIDLMLYLIADLAGPQCAVAVARFLVVYARRNGSDPQVSPWHAARNHLHPAVHRAQDAITADPARAWTVTTLAQQAHASKRHLSRLFNANAGVSVPDYVTQLRLALAETLLRQTRLDMEAVADRAGFGSARQLRRAWGRVHTVPPREWRAAAERS